jgi:hypothetical protein
MTAELVDQLVEYEIGREFSRINRSSTRYTGFLAVPAAFGERLRESRSALRGIAEQWLFVLYATHIITHSVPCNCKLALLECECESRFLRPPCVPVLAGPPRPKRPKAGRVLAKRSLYSGPVPHWWRAAQYDDDPIIRSHNKSARVGMKGFYAGTKGVWRNNNAVIYPEQDNRASTRDRDKTARDGEKALQKPYDDPSGTPKSFAIRSDVEPDNDDGVMRIGKRVVEDGVIVPGGEED